MESFPKELALQLYNTLRRKQEIFKPRNHAQVKIFTCGPSIYKRPHIGNYRTFLYEDILIRYLEYLGYKINRIINFTDVEDKGINEAAKQNRPLKKLTEEAAAYFFKDVKLLKIKVPTKIPDSASGVKQAVKIIQALIKKGYAYWYQGDVYFDPLKKKDFGKLFHLDMSQWPKKKVRFKRDNYDDNRWNFGDFILWHGYKEGETISWPTSIGRGRPAWHIQDPAIISELLGSQVDINCGGIDNIYRHHDYTIAIMEVFSGKTYANYYLHGEHLYVDGKKMSKSHGNIIYPDDLINKKFKPEQVRFFLGMTKHYRKKLYFTLARFKERVRFFDSLKKLIETLINAKTFSLDPHPSIDVLIQQMSKEFEQHMNNDLQVAAAIRALYKILIKLTKKHQQRPLTRLQQRNIKNTLKKINKVLNIF